MSAITIARASVALGVALAAAGCGGTTTGVALEIAGADSLGGDQVAVVGTVDNMVIDRATVPDTPRPLGHAEELRILVSDDLAGKVITISASILKGGRCVASQDGFGLLVLGRAKAIDLSFTAASAGCASATPDGGSH
jgi:hypothetical protein